LNVKRERERGKRRKENFCNTVARLKNVKKVVVQSIKFSLEKINGFEV